MKPLLLFILGLLTGSGLVFGLQYAESLPSQREVAPASGPVGGGYYSGPIPDFSVQPVSGNVFEYLDPNWTLVTTEKEETLFQSFKGKVIFMNLWATWCGPCIEEMPEIASLMKSQNPEEVAVLLISDEQERLVDAFENEHNLPLYVSRGKVPVIFKGKGLPSTFIIDKAGVIRYKHAGPATWSHPNVNAFLQRLLKEES